MRSAISITARTKNSVTPLVSRGGGVKQRGYIACTKRSPETYGKTQCLADFWVNFHVLACITPSVMKYPYMSWPWGSRNPKIPICGHSLWERNTKIDWNDEWKVRPGQHSECKNYAKPQFEVGETSLHSYIAVLRMKTEFMTGRILIQSSEGSASQHTLLESNPSCTQAPLCNIPTPYSN